jgi:AraC-like DNA-binding protein
MSSTDCYIRATALIGFQDLVEQRGGDVHALLSEAGLDPKALKNPDLVISYSKHAKLLELAAERLQRPSFGLELAIAAPDHLPYLGPVAMLGHFTDTLQEWIDAGQDFIRFQSNAFTIEQSIDENLNLARGRYVLNSFALPTRQLTEVALANVVRLSRHVTSRHELNPTLVRFQHSRPRDLSQHEQLFRCPVEFGAEHDEFLCDPSYLQFPTSGRLKPLRSLLTHYMKYRISLMARYDQSMRTTVELAVRSVLGTGKCTNLVIAESLGLTPKKLQRLLSNEGTSFSEILEGVRAEVAGQILSGSETPVGQLAGLLDYSTTAPFTLAFKRWTGTSPLAFRKKQRPSLD